MSRGLCTFHYLDPVVDAGKLLRGLSLAVAVDDRLCESMCHARLVKFHTVGYHSHVGAKSRVLFESLVDCIYPMTAECVCVCNFGNT